MKIIICRSADRRWNRKAFLARSRTTLWSLLLCAAAGFGIQLQATAAPQEAARDGTYVAYDDNTVLDTQSGLMWTRADSGAPIDWYGAQRYCAQLRLAGHTDWRLPTAQELALLAPPTKAKNPATASVTKLLNLTGTAFWSTKTAYESGHGTEPIANYANMGKNGKIEIAPKFRADLNTGDAKLWNSLRALAVRDSGSGNKQLADPFGKRVDRFRSRAGALTTAKNLPAQLHQSLADGLLADDTRAAMKVTNDTQLRSDATASLQLLLYPEWLPADPKAISIKSNISSNYATTSNWTAQWQQSGRWFQVTASQKQVHIFAESRDRAQIATPSEKALSAWSDAREILQFSESARLNQYEATRGYALVGLAPGKNAPTESFTLLTDGDIVSASFLRKIANP